MHVMTRHLGGWWRLWIVLAVIYGGLVVTYTWLSWPEVSNVSHEPNFLKQMSSEALAVVNRPKTLAELENALIAADRSGDTENARKLAQEIRRRRDVVDVQMPDGRIITDVPRGTTQSEVLKRLKKSDAQVPTPKQSWKEDPIILEMPNGYEFLVADDTTSEQTQLVARDYVRVLQSTVSERRIAAVGNAFLLWFVPSILVCALGLSVAWVLRGFKEGTSRAR